MKPGWKSRSKNSAGKKTADILYEEPGTIGEELVNTGKDVLTGSAYAATGEISSKVFPYIAGKIGKVFKPLLGRLTGAGTGAVEEAIKAGEQAGPNVFKSKSKFDKALRGEIKPEDIVSNAKTAISKVRDLRSKEYVAQLEKINLSPENLQNVRSKVVNTAKDLISDENFSIKVFKDQNGIGVDFSESPLVEGQPVVKKALQDVVSWKDNTAKGLDVLKKRLGIYASQTKYGTPAESFLSQLQKSLSDGLKSEVPGYAEMTKGYAEATKLVKDIESGLMLRKQGMTGRIVADQTLRRLLSSMKDNFELRRDLVKSLSSVGAEDISGQVAGYSMRSPIPLGLAGTGPALIGEAAVAKLVSPALWPALAASSPRLSAEFLRIFGKTMAEMQGTSGPAAALSVYKAMGNKE
jgi:hypothetical protein